MIDWVKFLHDSLLALNFRATFMKHNAPKHHKRDVGIGVGTSKRRPLCLKPKMG